MSTRVHGYMISLLKNILVEFLSSFVVFPSILKSKIDFIEMLFLNHHYLLLLCNDIESGKKVRMTKYR